MWSTKRAWQRIVDNNDDGVFRDSPGLNAADAFKTAHRDPAGLGVLVYTGTIGGRN